MGNNVLTDKSFRHKISAPRMAGRDSRKEYLAAVSRFKPRKRPTAIVEPDLDIPGFMAIPGISPIIKASFMEKRSIVLPSFLIQYVINKSKPVKSNIMPVRKTDEKI